MNAVVVADAEARARFVTPDSLALLGEAADVRELLLDALPADAREAALGEALTAADAVVFAPWGTYGVEGFSPECWQAAGRVRVIAGTFGHRFEEFLSLDLTELDRAGVTVVDTSRSNAGTVAEFGLAMILNLLRDLPDEIARVRAGGWRELWDWHDDGFVRGELTGRRVGLAGFGAIGRRLAELVAPFRCAVTTYDPFVDDATLAAAGVARAASLAELARGSEIFVVCIPRTPATLGVVDRDAIASLPAGALVAVLTRMAVVDQEALWARTRVGELRAAVDVYEPEPPPGDSPIRSDRNVLPTPHLGGNTGEANRRCFALACRETVAALAGRTLAYRLTRRDADVYAGRVSEESSMSARR